MDVLVILTETVCLKLAGHWIRKVIAGLVGAFFYCFVLVFPQFVYVQWIVPAFIVLIAFKYSGIRNFLKQLFIFYFINFVFGGVSFSIVALTNSEKFVVRNGVIVGNFNLILIFLGIVFGFEMIVYVFKRNSSHVLNDVVICIDDRVAEVRVLLDTGNLLREPYQNRPVVIVEKMAVKDIVDLDFNMSFEGNRSFDVDEGLNETDGKGFFLIPYRSIGNSGGMLIGIVPDYILVKESGKRYEDIVIGICNDELSESGEYSGIFGLDSLDGGSV